MEATSKRKIKNKETEARQKETIFKDACIYKIVDNETGETYYGSSYNIRLRQATHKVNTNHCVSRHIIKRNNYEFITIEEHTNISQWDLLEIEANYIMNNKCINTQVPHRTDAQYHQDNKEHIKEAHIKYVENNREHITEYKHNWYEENKARQLAIQGQKYTCICGKTLTIGHKARHERTTQHIEFCRDNNIK
jgi:hypothetical protein